MVTNKIHVQFEMFQLMHGVSLILSIPLFQPIYAFLALLVIVTDDLNGNNMLKMKDLFHICNLNQSPKPDVHMANSWLIH